MSDETTPRRIPAAPTAAQVTAVHAAALFEQPLSDRSPLDAPMPTRAWPRSRWFHHPTGQGALSRTPGHLKQPVTARAAA
ncbi:hypothetical protein [Streptomyces sp. NPDC005374]|uniref:hypothetical protein n=1 Tax=Streptomyces sp. NPDC005374 TaxID=3364713 RepID=UPI0036A4CB6E